MASIEVNMALRVWDQLNDKYDYAQLAQNWAKIGAHDHSSGKGVQIPTGGIADQAVTGPKIASEAVAPSHLSPEVISTISASAGFPVGMMIPYSGVVIPSGWLLADGSAVSRVTYSALWDVYRNGGSTSPHGNGNGTSTFNLPNSLGAIPLGTGSSGQPGATNHFLGQRGGEEKHALTSGENGPHAHGRDGMTVPRTNGYQFSDVSGDFGRVGFYAFEFVGETPGVQAVSGGSIQSSGSGTPHNNLPPFLAVQYLVKY